MRLHRRFRKLWLALSVALAAALAACDTSGEATIADTTAAVDTAAASDESGTGDTSPLPMGNVAKLAAPEPMLSGGLPTEAAIDETDRVQVDLGGTWRFRFDDDERGEAEAWFDPTLDRGDWDELPVPGTWDLSHPDGYDRQTVAWYATTFTPPALGPFVRLRFESVFREARVWLDGVEIGDFDLPYLPFSFDVTEALATGGSHTLVVRLDNRLTRDSLPCDTGIMSGKHGWWPFGGMTRPVTLEAALDPHVARVAITPESGGALTASVLLYGSERAAAEATLTATVQDATGETVLTWPETAVPTDGGAFQLAGTLGAPQLWSPESPQNVYRLVLRLTAADGRNETVAYDFSLKSFEARDGLFFLNGEERFLHGINRHEDHPTLGPLYDPDAVAGDLALFTELGVDFCRPGHYPNDVRVLRAMERAGVMISQEIPVYQLDEHQEADPVLIDRATRALERMITRDRNRPGIVMWSVANEIDSLSDSAVLFVRGLYQRAKEMTPERPVMVAHMTLFLIGTLDKSSGEVDVIGVNEYWGWYMGVTGGLTAYLEELHAAHPDKTFFVSEYGAGALQGTHLPDDAMVGEESLSEHSYSEEYQAWFHERHLEQMAALPYIRGVMPWVFADFRMQWNPTTGDPHPADRMNLKGLVSADRVKKLSFDVVRDAYRQLWP